MYEHIVSLTVSALVHLFSHVADEASKKLGEETGERIYALLRKKFGKDSYEKQTLERFKNNPSPERQSAFAAVLAEKIATDSELYKSLTEILKEADNHSTISVTQKAHHVNGNVYQVGGNISQLINPNEGFDKSE